VERQRVGGQTEVVPTGTNTVGVKPRWRWGTVTVMATWADSPDTAVNLHCPAGHRFGAITGKRVLSYFHDGYADDQGVVWLTREGPLRP
jgi:hypothetical protein